MPVGSSYGPNVMSCITFRDAHLMSLIFLRQFDRARLDQLISAKRSRSVELRRRTKVS